VTCHYLLIQAGGQEQAGAFSWVMQNCKYGSVKFSYSEGVMMQARKYLELGFLTSMSFSTVAISGAIETAIEEGTVGGNIRAYYNTRDFETKTDESAFSLGGALRAETGSIGPFKFGLGYYTAQDVGTNSSDPAKVNKRLGGEIEVLGEAYVSASAADTLVTAGRQRLSTPFANDGDAFMIPFSFEGGSIKNKSVPNLTLELDYINSIKNRNSDEFVDVGKYSTGRFGVDATATSGTTILGAVYAVDGLKLQAWAYEFSDLFTSVYIQGNYNFSVSGDVKPFFAAQIASQSETGDELLGEVDSTLWGLQGGAGFGKSKLTLAYTAVEEESGTFRNGAFLAPYSFSTSPIFTNNMLATVENVDAGDALKLTYNYSFSKVKLKLSYAEFDFETAADLEAVDVDVTYNMDEIVKGLTARWRLEVVSSDVDRVEQINHRFQLQLKF
jgi:hypothetical protein